MAKKNNHTVSKTLLKRWKTVNKKIWLLDLASQKIEDRSVESTFAIEDYVYVPKINGIRNDMVEDWFEKPENELAIFLDYLLSDQQNEFSNFKEEKFNADFLKLGITGLGYRSSYDIQNVIKNLSENEQLRVHLGISLETHDEKHRYAVENMKAVIDLAHQSLMDSRISTVDRFHKDFLICDRPGIDMPNSKLFSLPIGPRTLISLDSNCENGFEFSFAMENKESDEIVDLVNIKTIEKARKWIVGTSKEHLESILPEVTPDKLKERISRDFLAYLPISEEKRLTLRTSLPVTKPKKIK